MIFGSFHRYWSEWEGKLDLPITKCGAKLCFPKALSQVAVGNGLIKFTPVTPICIYKAPQKSASRKRNGSHMQTIFITGDFTLRDVEEPPYLVSANCSISFFDTKIEQDGCHVLQERDAMHFDIESCDQPRAFHPVFHVQHDRSNALIDDDIKTLIAQVSRSEKNMIQVVRDGVIGVQHLRVPTPQMDIFSVLTMVVADFFCKDGEKDERVKQSFISVLEQLGHQNNFARHGVVAEELRERAEATYFSPQFWYPESKQQTRHDLHSAGVGCFAHGQC